MVEDCLLGVVRGLFLQVVENVKLDLLLRFVFRLLELLSDKGLLLGNARHQGVTLGEKRG